MRKLVIAAPVLLAACANTTAAPPVHGTVSGRICYTQGTGQFIGQPGNSDTGAAILKATNSAKLRWAPPGYMLTMDFSASRVTVHLGSDYRITEITCG